MHDPSFLEGGGMGARYGASTHPNIAQKLVCGWMRRKKWLKTAFTSKKGWERPTGESLRIGRPSALVDSSLFTIVSRLSTYGNSRNP